MVSTASRVSYSGVEGAEDLLTPDFLDYVVEAYDKFADRVQEVRDKREALLRKALNEGVMPTFLPDTRSGEEWQVPEVPDDLKQPGIEISGPVSITNMAINAVNPGPEGERAVGYLDDDEDSGGHRLVDTLNAARNRLGITERTLSFHNPARNRTYTIADGDTPFFMHRERGWHLDEAAFTVDGKPISATLLGKALTFAYGGKAQVERGQGLYFYLPKVEVVEEAALYRDFFDFSRERLGYPDDAVIRGIFLVESLPAVYIMEDLMHELGPYAAGLNAARWDLKASILEYVMTDPAQVWPDRFGVDIKTTEFLSNIFRRLVAVCLKHGAVAIGGMATALPSWDEAVNAAAAAAIRADKEWEAAQGFTRGWVAHIFHMGVAAAPFKTLADSGWRPSAAMHDPDNYPVAIVRPEGPVTLEGTRRNLRTLLEYLEGWLGGRGAKGIDSLEGRPGLHTALMEDLATARISAAQTAQRILHAAPDDATGAAHTLELVKAMLLAEE